MAKLSFDKGNFSSNVLTLVSGTIIAQAIPIAVSPILTPIFSPDDFGLFGLYFALVSILSVPVTGRYEMAIMLPERDEDAVNVMGLSILSALIVSFVLLIISFFLHGYILEFFEDKRIGTWIYVVAISSFLVGFYQSLNYWFNRKARYKALVTSRVFRSANTSGFSIVLGLLKIKSGGLILGDMIGQAVASLFLLKRFLKHDKDKIKAIKFDRMKVMAKRYDQFPKFNVISGLLEKGSGQMPVLLLTSFFSLATVGFFSFTQRVVGAPGAIVARAFGDVFRQQASEAYAKTGQCETLFKSLFKKLLIIAIVPFTALFFAAPWAFKLIFGAEWVVAGEYTQIMTFMFFLQFIVSPLSIMFLVAEKQKIDLFMQIFLFCSVFISFFVGYKLYNDVKICLLFFTAAYSIKYLIEFYLSYRFSLGKKY